MTTIRRRTFLALASMPVVGAVVAACRQRGEPDPGDGPADAGDGLRRERIAYADHADGFADLWWAADGADAGPLPVVVLVHGGFWRANFRLDLMDDLARSAAGEGYVVWNIEYRRVGAGGGWPETFEDVAASVDHLAELAGRGDADGGDDARPELDLDRVAIVGHSAGGHLATWIAGRHVLPPGAPGAEPLVRPVVAFPQAGVLDLVACARAGVGNGACPDLLGGGPDDVPDRYAIASPAAVLPIGVPVVAVHGVLDRVVPVQQSRGYVEAATDAGDPAELVLLPDTGHFEVIDAGHESWRAVLERLPDHLGG